VATPTFLYELIWNLPLVAGFVVYMDPQSCRPRPRAGAFFALYVAGLHPSGRTWIELMRPTDGRHHVFRVRINVLGLGPGVSSAAVVFFPSRPQQGFPQISPPSVR